MKTIRVATSVTLPNDSVTQTFAFLARRGAGKTYGAMKLAEGMLDAGAQVVALDPVGVWYGLRIAKDGKGKGFDIPIFGGMHGDIPLEPGAGALIADLVVDRGISAVLDVSLFHKNERKQFATSFAEQLFYRKKQCRSPLHLFIEEAQTFVPQRTTRGEARMLGAFEDLVKLGRNLGIGVTLISQRPQAVNKDALNQTEALFVMQTNGAQERKALSDWIVEQGVTTKGIVDELPSLPIGTAYLWSPSWLRKLEKVRIGERKTYDASATPTASQARIEPRPLSKEELAQVEHAMAATIAKAKADDPKELRKQIAELQRQVGSTPAVVEKVVERVEVSVLPDSLAADLRSAAQDVGRLLDRLVGAASQIQDALARLPRPSPAPVQAPTPVPPVQPQQVEVNVPTGGSLGKGERATMIAVAQYPDGVGRNELSVLTGYKRSSRDTYIQRLRNAGYVETSGGVVLPTKAGIDALGSDYQPLPEGEALRHYWLRRLPEGERAVLGVLIESFPNSVDRASIDNATGYKRSSRDTYIQRLRSRRLVEVKRDGVRASEKLFATRGT